MLIIAVFGTSQAPKASTQVHIDQPCDPIQVGPNGISTRVVSNNEAQWQHLNFASAKSINFSSYTSGASAADNTEKSVCSDIIGVIGHDNLKKREAILLSFTDMTMCKMKPESVQKIIEEGGFSEISSKFRRSHFEIMVSINWKTYSYTFDTNEPGNFLMPYSDKLSFIREQAVTISKRGGGGSISSPQIFPFTKIWVDGIAYSSPVEVSQEGAKPRVGLGFIKGFDWIIDYKRAKVYYRKNENSIELYNPHLYRAELLANKIVIVQTPKLSKLLNVGDVVISVNRKGVTDENVCELFSQLTSSSEWSSLDLEIQRQ